MIRRRAGLSRAAAAVLVLWAAPSAAAGTPDAGAHRGNVPAAPGNAEAVPGTPRSRFFPKLIENPGVLSEKVRARLEENARQRALQANGDSPSEPRLPLQAERGAPVIERVAAPSTTPLRRMISFENDEGVTILSNRPRDLEPVVEAPAAVGAPGQSDFAEPARSPAASPAPAEAETTETRPLRPKPRTLSRESRSSLEASAPEQAGSSWPWLLLGAGAFAGLGSWGLRRYRRGARAESRR